MLGESRDIVGEEEVGGGKDEDYIAIGGKNAATSVVVGATLCVPNYWLHVRLEKKSSGGMATASPQAPPLSFDRQSIVNAIAVYGIGSPSCVEEIYCWFEE